MSETPETPADDGGVPPDVRAFGAGEKILAGVLLAGTVLLAYVCLDVIAGGRVTRALSAPPEGEQ